MEIYKILDLIDSIADGMLQLLPPEYIKLKAIIWIIRIIVNILMIFHRI
jgi:hypothetical protein